MKKFIAFILVILSIGLIFVSCNGTDKPADETGNQNSVEKIQLFKDGASEYSIVHTDNASADLLDEISKLNTAIKEEVGKDLPLKDDLVNEDLGILASPYEIIIGDCDRDAVREIKSTLRTDDNIIKVVGTQIVILGGCEESTVKAVGTFRRMCIYENGSTGFEFDKDYVLRYDGSYDIGDLKLNGTPINEYIIAYESGNYTPAVNRFNEKLKKIAGVSLEVETALQSKGYPHRILFGNCKTGISDGVKTDNGEYRILSDGNDVCIVAASAMQADDAVIGIIEKYFPAGKQETFDIKIGAGTDEKVSLNIGKTLKVLNQNLWENGYSEDLEKQIITRHEYLKEIFDQKRPDVICFQEASHDRKNPNNKGKSIYDFMYNDLTPLYNVICEKRTDDNGGSFTPIFYRADLYTVIDYGCYKFADRFDDSNNKSLAWVVFESKVDGKRFGIINCHFALFMDKYNDENRGEKEEKYGYTGQTDAGQGEIWRKGNVQEVIARYTLMRNTYGEDLPVVMTGDFNANPDKTSYKMLANYADFADSRLVSTGPSTQDKSSWHNCGKSPKNDTSMLLDHMFVTKDVITVLSHEIVINSRAIRGSDHCAVVCEFQFK